MNHNFYRTFNSDSSSSSTLANIKREEDGTIRFYITVMVVCVMEGYAPIEPFFLMYAISSIIRPTTVKHLVVTDLQRILTPLFGTGEIFYLSIPYLCEVFFVFI